MKSEGKRPLGRPVHTLEYNIRMDIKKMQCEDMERIELAQEMIQW
jgi:hypothetical protein